MAFPIARSGAAFLAHQHQAWRRLLAASGGVLPWLTPLFLVAAWELAALTGGLSPQVLPAPSKVVQTAAALISRGELLPDLAISLLRAASGFVIGGAVGFALGVTVGFAQKRQTTLKPVTDAAFIVQLQTAATWLSDRHVLPEPISVGEHLARL